MTIFTNKISSLTKASQKTTDVFTKTVKNLEGINHRINVHQSKLQTKAERIASEQEVLNAQTIQNMNIISKISSIFN